MEQENTDLLDTQHPEGYVKKSWTIRLLIVGGGMIAITFLVATFWNTLGMTRNDSIWLALTLMVSFGINLAGVIVGFVERKKNPKRAWIGIIGNSLLVLLFVSIVAYSISLMVEVRG